MDRERFDALARLLATTGSRRAALGALIGAGIAGAGLEAEARKSKDRKARKGKDRKKRSRVRTEAVSCCSTGNCTPGKGKNLARCCFEDAQLANQNFTGSNLSEANFSGADLTGADFRRANLNKTCFVDADITGAKFNSGTNLTDVIFCRTQTDTGENNSGCGLGTPCCPTCDADNPCGADQVCCRGRCIPGDCCDNGEESTCGPNNICCDNTCVEGNCCAVANCAVQTCQQRTCENNQCTYEPIDGREGPRCRNGSICCDGTCETGECCSNEQCENPEPVCNNAHTCVACTANNQCGSDGACTCGANDEAGQCREDFFQGFEQNTAGWTGVNQVASNTNGIPARTGGFYAQVPGPASGSAGFTRWGGYTSVFPDDGYTTELAIYLDPAGPANAQFDYSSAVSTPNCGHLRDFVFTAGKSSGNPNFCVTASNNSPGFPCNPARNPQTITTAGWYLFRHEFRDNGSGVLEVDMTLVAPSGTPIFTWTLSDPTDVIGTAVGGNRYGWFSSNDFTFVAIDDSSRVSD